VGVYVCVGVLVYVCGQFRKYRNFGKVEMTTYWWWGWLRWGKRRRRTVFVRGKKPLGPNFSEEYITR